MGGRHGARRARLLLSDRATGGRDHPRARAGHARPHGRRLPDRHHARPHHRHRQCGAASLALRLRGHHRGDGRPVGADLLVRPSRDHRLRGRPALDPLRRHRDAGRAVLALGPLHSPDRAGLGARPLDDRDVEPLRALERPGGRRPGLHPHRPRQGATGTHGAPAPHAAQCAHPAHHAGRAGVPQPLRRRAGDRDGVLVAGRGPALPRLAQLPGLRRDSGAAAGDLAGSLLADIGYAAADPRIRLG